MNDKCGRDSRAERLKRARCTVWVHSSYKASKMLRALEIARNELCQLPRDRSPVFLVFGIPGAVPFIGDGTSGTAFLPALQLCDQEKGRFEETPSLAHGRASLFLCPLHCIL
ncbi:uncharacterized protein LOC119371996 [Rhipicephalus sanguineus]|uniref:uncharacterized protein LOC119371996 n=1 Tax=Rhipicephalus sanguineus TaxID=34632 RepID=UPI0020C4BD6C|nr:uncharacterized protein LOC119371996 [Rhipicephalus sanguineus]